MIYGYIRVSSDKQTVENQRFEINKFCDKEKIVINDWIEETISGTKLSAMEESIKAKVEAAGKPLKDWENDCLSMLAWR